MKPEVTIKSHKESFLATKVTADSLYQAPDLSIDYYNLMKGNSLQVTMTEDDGSLNYEDMNKEITFIVLTGGIDFVVEGVKYETNGGDVLTLSKASSFGIYSREDQSHLICVAPLTNKSDDTYQVLMDDVHKFEERDLYTKGHNDRVGKYAQMIMQRLDPEYHSKDIFFLGATHDIGKINIPLEIINKPGKLTDEEFDIMKKHPIYSYEILKEKIGSKKAGYARWHHERLDGSGYPDGLAGDEIPLEARVIAVADVFDAITSKRSYREKMELSKALAILDDEVSRNHLDKRCVEALKELLENGVLDVEHEQSITDKYLM